MVVAQKAFTVKKNIKGKDGKSYSIAFKLNGISVGVLNYNTVRDADAAMTLECDFLLNGEAYTSKSCRLGCYDARGNLLGTEITSTDATSIIAEVGNLYLSKGCKNIQCSFAIDGGEYSDSLTVVTDGVSVTVKNTAYKYYISSSPNDKPDWSKIASTSTPPQPTIAKGNYLYVMTIVTYSDGTETSTVTVSYCGTDGDSIKVTSTSVTYAVTDDAKQPADSAFTYTSVPEVKDGQYLWCKTVVTYSDGNSTKSYAVSRVVSDGDQGYSLHFAYADSVSYSGSAPTVTGFSTTRKESSEWLGVNRSLEVEDPTDPTAYEWTKIKGTDGRDVYRLEVISSAGLVYHNGSLNTVLSAHIWGPNGEVTDRCNGTFTWYDLRVSNPIGTGKTYAAQATSAVDAYHYRCIYNGDVSKETYNVVYDGKQLQYNSKNIQF